MRHALRLTLLFVAVSGGLALATGAADAGRRWPPHSPAGRLSMRAVFPNGVRTLDGSGNNLRQPEWGEVNTPYVRVGEASYADAIGAMVEGPDARYISNRVFNDTAQNLFSENGVTQWAFTWGQFLDHTFGLRQAGTETAPLSFDATDPLEEFTNELGAIAFERTLAAPGTGVSSPREQLNTVSAYIDAWAVYGGTDERLEWMREGPVDGDLSNNSAFLLTAEGGYLPGATERGDAATSPAMELTGALAATPGAAVVAGDVRANENVALTSVHTLFVREHNRIVALLPDRLPEELKFQIARRIVGAEQQYITYHEFLPALGVELAPYRGYDRGVDAGISNEFAVVGYRAHSMIHGEIEAAAEAAGYTPEELASIESQGVEVVIEGGEVEFIIPLNVAFGNPALVEQIGLAPILAGLAAESQYKNDEQIDNQLRSVLFQIPGPDVADPAACLDGPELPGCFSTVLDLGAIDVERGRDHGIPSYNDLREAYGLSRKESFAAITGEATDEFPNDPEIDALSPIDDPDILDFVQLFDADGHAIEPGSEEADGAAVRGVRRTSLAARLKAIYGDVDRVDAFVGMVAEPHLTGTEFGELQLAMWRKQFEALRDGDRFFYEHDPALRRIERAFGIGYKHTLAEIIARNTGLSAGDLPPNVFNTGDPPVAGAGGTPSQVPASCDGDVSSPAPAAGSTSSVLEGTCAPGSLRSRGRRQRLPRPGSTM